MRLQINKGEFMKNWQIAERSASSKSTINSLTGVFIRTSETDNSILMEATDLKTSVKCVSQGVLVEEEGEAVLPVRLVGELFKRNDHRRAEQVQVHNLRSERVSQTSCLGERGFFLCRFRIRTASDSFGGNRCQHNGRGISEVLGNSSFPTSRRGIPDSLDGRTPPLSFEMPPGTER